MDLIEITFIVLVVLYFAFLVWEKLYYSSLRKKIKLVIHVNGIRGKSTTTRLIASGLKECGYKVFAKTTGTIPCYITPDGEEVKIVRKNKANIREQLKMLKLANSYNADVLVIECMAVNPELQKICEEQILKANITVITNEKLDHIGQMGENLEDIATAFCNTIPTSGSLVIGDDLFLDLYNKEAERKDTKVYLSNKENDDFDTFGQNIANAMTIAEILSIDKDKYRIGLSKYIKDPGSYCEIRLNDTIFINGFSINDPESIEQVYNKVKEKYNDEVTILLNSRDDRNSRIIQHLELIKKLGVSKVYLAGAAMLYLKNKLEKENIEVVILDDYKKLENEKIVFACGNIGGEGIKILDYFKSNGETL